MQIKAERHCLIPPGRLRKTNCLKEHLGCVGERRKLPSSRQTTLPLRAKPEPMFTKIRWPRSRVTYSKIKKVLRVTACPSTHC